MEGKGKGGVGRVMGERGMGERERVG